MAIVSTEPWSTSRRSKKVITSGMLHFTDRFISVQVFSYEPLATNTALSLTTMTSQYPRT